YRWGKCGDCYTRVSRLCAFRKRGEMSPRKRAYWHRLRAVGKPDLTAEVALGPGKRGNRESRVLVACQIQRAAAAPLPSGRVLKAMAACGAARWMALTTASKRISRLGGWRRPAPITTQS